MTEPLISIGIPTYNNPDGLEKILINFINQSYPNMEIIISVNPSENAEVNKKYRQLANHYLPFHWHFQETNIGLHWNFWFVMQEATGKYFMYAQDDDDWSQGFIRGLVDLLESNTTVPVAMSNIQRRDETGQIFDSIEMKDISVLNAMHDEKIAYLFMGIWRLEKLREYSSKVFSDVATCSMAVLDGGVMINPKELYTKGMRHGKAQEQVKNDPFWYFRIYYYLLKGVSLTDKKMVVPVACMNLIWVIRSYAAQVMFLLPVDHPIRRTIRKLTSHN